MKVKACSDFIREKGEGSKAPRPDPAPGGQRAEVLGVHPKEQKTNILLTPTNSKHTPRAQARLLKGQRFFPLTLCFYDSDFGRSTELGAPLTPGTAKCPAPRRLTTPHVSEPPEDTNSAVQC